ncbi:MAG: hypothetical protein WCF04_09555, partial [Candidatus Nanopelagicales bacterium]
AEATTDPVTQALAEDYCSEDGDAPSAASVWFSYTAVTPAFVVSMADSNYDGALMVTQGNPTAPTRVNCWAHYIEAEPGATYYIVASAWETGGNLVLDVQAAPPPPEITFQVTSGTVDRDGSVHLAGTYSCRNASSLSVSGQVTQRVGRTLIRSEYFWTGYDAGSEPALTCDGAAQPWASGRIRPDTGVLAPGKAVVSGWYSASGEYSSADGELDQEIRLRRNAK